MTIISIAVRLAPNIERGWINLQDELFRYERVLSARVMEPVIPVVTFSASQTSCDLDALVLSLNRIRKTHCLALAECDTRTMYSIAGNHSPLDVPVPLSGFDALRKSLGQLVIDGIPESQVEPVPVIRLGWDAPDSLEADRRRAIRARVHPVLPPLPATRAFWLRVLGITSESDSMRNWWRMCQWTELFSRRCTVYESAPP